ncbi:hypothetical protein EV421DRAFT_1696068, partial [Armillaria borealis]
NLKVGGGQMDSKSIKRVWSKQNRYSNSTKEMSPSLCHDTLDDQFGVYNCQKVVGL